MTTATNAELLGMMAAYLAGDTESGKYDLADAFEDAGDDATATILRDGTTWFVDRSGFGLNRVGVRATHHGAALMIDDGMGEECLYLDVMTEVHEKHRFFFYGRDQDTPSVVVTVDRKGDVEWVAGSRYEL